MTLEENIKAILECNFAIAREEVIEATTQRIMEQISRQNPLEEELEKIKDEILNLGFTGWADKPKLDREEVLTILDKYISELSGDNKQSRCNNCQNNTDELSGECYECVKGIEDWYEPDDWDSLANAERDH